MKTLGKIIQEKRKSSHLLVRELAEKIGVDAALVSKFENDQRIPTKVQISKISNVLNFDHKKLLVSWMGAKLLKEIEDEPYGLEALKVAEEQVKYTITKAKKSVPVNLEGLIKEADLLKEKLNTLRQNSSYRITEAFDLEYTFESNKIEGNTLTLRETDLVVNKGLTIAGKSMREHLEAINHTDAIVFVRELVEKRTPLTESVLLQLHNLVLRGINPANAGKYRNVQVYISGSKHLPPQPFLVPKLMEGFFEWFEKNHQILHPILLAAEMHERLVTVHPFIDGNGRTARLLMNLILLRHGYVVANIKGDVQHRMQYYEMLEKAQIDGEKTDFLEFIIHTEIFDLKKYIHILKS
ncbi:MAG: Fic family protein [Bacteroidia bacterium]|nr:Fic family protein [Bacteroidia bacterium]